MGSFVRGCLAAMIVVAAPLLARADAASETRGPNGETPVDYREIVLSDQEKAEVRQGGYKAAILMHTTSDFSNALEAGAKSVFEELNIRLVVTTDAEMDPSKQRTDVETAMAMQPDLLIALVIDPVSGAVAFRPAVAAGMKLVFVSNLPNGFEHGRDYAGIVTDDLFGMGRAMAEMMADGLGGQGKVALIYHDANYYVTNQRDRAVKAVLAERYPGIEIVAEKGIANPEDGEAVASAILTQHPDIRAIYAPWDAIAEGVVAAARAAGRRDLQVYTMDLGAANAVDLVKGGNMAGIVSDLPYEIGRTLARIGAKSLLKEDTPSFVIVPATKITRQNIAGKWREILNRDAPQEVLDALN